MIVGSLQQQAQAAALDGTLGVALGYAHMSSPYQSERFNAWGYPNYTDGNLLTGGGITAGIDFALNLAAELYGDDVAQLVQLQLEYAPAPPFASGDPRTAPASVLQQAKLKAADSLKQRTLVTQRAAARLASARG